MEFIPPLPSNIPKMVAGRCLLAGVFHPRCLANQWGTPKLGFDTICFLIFSRWATNFVSLPTPAPPNKKKRKTSTDLSFFRLFGVEGLLLLLDLGCHAHHAGGSDACESTRAFVCFDLHVLCLERLCHLGVMTIPAGWPKKGDVFCDINIWKRMLQITWLGKDDGSWSEFPSQMLDFSKFRKSSFDAYQRAFQLVSID